MAETDPTTDPVDIGGVVDQVFDALLEKVSTKGVSKAVVSTLLEKEGAVKALLFELVEPIALKAGQALRGLETFLLPILAPFVAPTVSGLFGAEIDDEAFVRRMSSGSGTGPARAIVDGLMRAIAGDASAEIEPSTAGALRIASAAVTASLESEFNAVAVEMLGDFLPFDVGHISALTALPEAIIRTLGVSRLVRRALTPLINATCATPLDWQVKRTYRPTLLTPASVIRQAMRGSWDWDDAMEECARAGYSSARIDALINEQAKFLSPADLFVFTQRGQLTQDESLQHLRDQGYDDDAASLAGRLQGLRYTSTLADSEANAAIGAFVSRDLDEATFLSAMTTAISGDAQRNLLIESARARQAVNVKHLSATQAAAAVKAGVLANVDYRAALEREGYPPDEIDVLDLVLRTELDAKTTLDQHRAQQAADKQAAADARGAALAAKQAQVDAARTLARRGTETALEDAFVRGLIPLARLEEVYRAHYDDDTVTILDQRVQQRRDAFVAAQAAHDQAAKRGAAKGIDVGALEQAVLTGVITLDDFRSRLGGLGFSSADVDVLVGTTGARKAALDAAAAKRDEATAAARKRSISLPSFELLVRRGHRTLDDYRALLSSLNYDDASIADLVDLLQLKIDDDAKAAALRASTTAGDAAKGLSLEQARRAVVLNLQSVDWFQSWLLDHQYSTDAQIVLTDELRADVEEAEAARARRAQVPTPTDARTLSLATLAKAARLGLIDVTAYRDRLVALGYSGDDVEIDVDLLLAEIAQTQQQRTTRETPPAAATARGLSLAQLETAVKLGDASINDYSARATALGYAPADVTVLVDVLSDEVSTYTAARQQHQQVAFELAGRGVNLQDLDSQVKAGSITTDDYVQALAQLGYDTAEGELLATLLVLDEQRAGAGK